MASTLLPEQANAFEVSLYLSSLASSRSAVKPLTDSIDALQSRPGFDKNALSPDDISALHRICWQLAIYLTSEEAVRHFTIEDLERRITQRFTGKAALRNTYLGLGFTLLLALVVGVVCSFIPPPMPLSEEEYRTFIIVLTIPSVFSVLSIGAAVFFYNALQYFSRAQRRIYTTIVAGVTILGIAHLQLPVLAYMQSLRSAWVDDGIIGFIYVPAHILIFIGTVLFARTVGVRNVFASWYGAIGVCIVASAALYFAPHAPALTNELIYDISTSISVIGIVVSASAAINSYLTAKKINEIYRTPMHWLGHANLLLSLSVAQILFVQFVVRYDNVWVDYGLLFVPYLVASLAFLKAGFSFNKVSNL